MTPEERLRELGHELEVFPVLAESPIVPVVISSATAYISGQPPARGGAILYRGRVGEAVSVEDGYLAARWCTLNGLGALKHVIGSLDRVEQVVKVLGFVNCGPEFRDHSKVLNGASELLVAIFGDAGRHARSAIGVASLPAQMSVEVEMVLRVAE
jgi:enamine deaminase RidA (YjgF/YER057c/UK114 family)